ncbi:glycosyltransferase [Aquipuribacter nitratireducens]|uniref:Glycosyltransferase n=1 Tax=Aquipuribacter nitratireducens TaxID=650104 RepID=A0ABW0GII5_9MICO
MNGDPRPGVTVVVPCYQAGGTVLECLESLRHQRLPRAAFDVVVIHNGPPDPAEQLVRRMARRYPTFGLTQRRSPEGAAAARNVGIEASDREHVTFVDHDDVVTPNYLRGLLEAAGPGVVATAQLADRDPRGGALPESDLSRALRAAAGHERQVGSLPQVIGYSVGKLVPRAWLDTVRFDPSLRSGEDVEFYHRLFRDHPARLLVTPPGEDCTYVRTVRTGSLGRREVSWGFSVEERLAVVARLHAARDPDRAPGPLLATALAGQAWHMNRYLRLHPQDRTTVVDAVLDLGVTYFPFPSLNRSMARAATLAYRFSPYAGPAHEPLVRLLEERGEVHDVLQADLDGHHPPSWQWRDRTNRHLDERVLLAVTDPADRSPAAVEAYVERLVEAVRERAARKRYDTLVCTTERVEDVLACRRLRGILPGVRWVCLDAGPASDPSLDRADLAEVDDLVVAGAD